MKALILGGTNFIGRHLIEQLKIQHPEIELTLFNRGTTNTHLFPELARITGDRETDDIVQLANQEWDYVFDLSNYFPANLQKLYDQVRSPRLKKYIYISTTSVYDVKELDLFTKDESYPLVQCAEEHWHSRDMAHYGELKAACEVELQRSGLPHVILRPSIVYGPYDYTDRFYYWLHQVKFKDKIMVPESGSLAVTYVVDLANAMILAMDVTKEDDIYNIITFSDISIPDIVKMTESLLDRQPDWVYASPDFLIEHDVEPWRELPVWLNGEFYHFNNEKMVNKLGVEPSGLQESMEATIAYFDELNWPDPKAGIKPAKLNKLLERLEKS